MSKKLVSLVFAAVLILSLLCTPACAVGVLPQPDEYYYGSGYIAPDYGFTPDYGFVPDYGITPDYGFAPDMGYGSGAITGDSYSYSNSVQPPYISSSSGSVQGSAGGVPVALRVDAYSHQGANLGYQWYVYDSYGGLTAIPGANYSSYTPECVYGTRTYCVGVYAVSGGFRSDETYSEPMSVTYTGVEIVTLPSKSSYYVGDRVDLSGLAVRVYDNSGTYWTSYNGNGLSVYPAQITSAGTVAIEVSDGFSSDVFYVNAGTEAQGKAANHTHEFGEWEVTKEATCVTTGVRTKTCACGETQTEEILKTEHSWDDGTITKEATANNNGSRLYTCTICQANRSEIIPAGTQSPRPTTSLDAAAAANPNVIINQGNPNASGTGSTYNNSGNNTYSNANVPSYASNNPANTNASMPQSGTLDSSQNAANAENASQTGTVTRNKESSGWWLIPVSAVVLVGTGIGAYYLMQKKSGE
ncbi:MAG: hypothetical protein IJB09_09640 [Oscillospiraceae bacterium]|nr:hypothetical protein [Oscillospiraceae bacterium]